MEEVIAVSFHDRRRAAQAFNLLWQMNDKLVIELDDAVVVHRDRSGNLEYDQDVSFHVGRNAHSSRVLGSPARRSRRSVICSRREVILDPAVLGGCILVGGMIGVCSPER